MPVRIVLVHDEPGFSASLSESLTEAGYEVTAFANPLNAFNALQAAGGVVDIDLLITRFRFGTAQPIGPSLARLARASHPNIKIIFVARLEFLAAARDLGEFIPAPAEIEDVMGVVARTIAPLV